jgi:DNA-binding CsgD family transcriptional regulator
MSAVSLPEMCALIGAVFDAGLDATGAAWPGVLEQLSRLIAGGGPVVLTLERRRFNYTQTHYVRTGPAHALRYQSSHARIDPVPELVLTGAVPGALFCTDALMPTRGLRRTDLYADWLRPLGLGAGAATVLVRHGPATASLYVMRPRHSGGFSSDHLAALALLLPHVATAVRASLRLAAMDGARNATTAALDHCTDAILLVDAACGVHFANGAAEALLTAADGLTIERGRGTERGRLRGATPAATAALRHLVTTAAYVAQASSGTSGPGGPGAPRRNAAVPLVRPSGQRALAALAAPLSRARQTSAAWAGSLASPETQASVVLFVSDPTTPAPEGGDACRARLTASYQLTPAEASVALAVGRGTGLMAVAADRGVALATIRTQAQRVYQKTGVRGQAALARLVEQIAHAR